MRRPLAAPSARMCTAATGAGGPRAAGGWRWHCEGRRRRGETTSAAQSENRPLRCHLEPEQTAFEPEALGRLLVHIRLRRGDMRGLDTNDCRRDPPEAARARLGFQR
jgi:hypothetical protein